MSEPVSPPIVIGSWGMPLLVDTKQFDLTGASSIHLRFWKPDGTEAVQVTTGVDDNGAPTEGFARWTAVTQGYFDEAGEWKVVVEVNYAAGVRQSDPPGRIPVVEAGKN